jgi:hypothetical protein
VRCGAMIAPAGAFDKVNRAPRAQQTATLVVDCAKALKPAALRASESTSAVVAWALVQMARSEVRLVV